MKLHFIFYPINFGPIMQQGATLEPCLLPGWLHLIPRSDILINHSAALRCTNVVPSVVHWIVGLAEGEGLCSDFNFLRNGTSSLHDEYIINHQQEIWYQISNIWWWSCKLSKITPGRLNWSSDKYRDELNHYK